MLVAIASLLSNNQNHLLRSIDFRFKNLLLKNIPLARDRALGPESPGNPVPPPLPELNSGPLPFPPADFQDRRS